MDKSLAVNKIVLPTERQRERTSVRRKNRRRIEPRDGDGRSRSPRRRNKSPADPPDSGGGDHGPLFRRRLRPIQQATEMVSRVSEKLGLKNERNGTAELCVPPNPCTGAYEDGKPANAGVSTPQEVNGVTEEADPASKGVRGREHIEHSHLDSPHDLTFDSDSDASGINDVVQTESLKRNDAIDDEFEPLMKLFQSAAITAAAVQRGSVAPRTSKMSRTKKKGAWFRGTELRAAEAFMALKQQQEDQAGGSSCGKRTSSEPTAANDDTAEALLSELDKFERKLLLRPKSEAKTERPSANSPKFIDPVVKVKRRRARKGRKATIVQHRVEGKTCRQQEANKQVRVGRRRKQVCKTVEDNATFLRRQRRGRRARPRKSNKEKKQRHVASEGIIDIDSVLDDDIATVRKAMTVLDDAIVSKSSNTSI